MKKRLLITALVVFTICLVAGCATTETSEGEIPEAYTGVIEEYISALGDPSTYDMYELGDFGGGDFFEAGLDGLGYSLYDINSDGTPELFLGNVENGKYFAAVYTIEDGEAKKLVTQAGSDTFTSLLGEVPDYPTYENGIATSDNRTDAMTYSVYTLDGTDLVRVGPIGDQSAETYAVTLPITPFSEYGS